MRVFIVAVGTAGDVQPFMALGLELKRRGHQVTLVTGNNYEVKTRKAGLDFIGIMSAREFSEIVDNPDYFHPRLSLELVYRKLCLPLTPPVYHLISEHHVPGETGVIAHSFMFGARVAQEKWRIPTVTVHLQPFFFQSVYETPVAPGLSMHRFPRWLKKLYFRGLDLLIDHRLAAGINAFRRTLGLTTVRGFQSRWLHSPDGVLGLFPSWFASPQPDWPPHVHLTGFPMYDDAAEDPLTPELSRFLDAGEPPIIFTIGSTLQAKWFFDAAVEACERLQCRGLLINRFFDQRRRDLPQILHTAYVPYNAVFPRCQAVVHHGGIGTTSQAMAAGVPQLIVPMCADQPDNALRVERLGVGFQFARADFDGRQLSESLRRLLNDGAFTKQARVIASRVDGREAVAAACDVIEHVFQKKTDAS